MDRPGSKAVGIGTEAHVQMSELFASAGRWRPILRREGAALHVATITQGTCSSIHIAAPSSHLFALLCCSLGTPSRDTPHWISVMADKTSSMASENDSVTFTVSLYFVPVKTNSIHSLDPLDAISSR